MAQKYVQIIFRNDRCENWKQNNPVLDKSELGFALFSDGTWRYKVGDGKTPWNEMSWGDSNLKVVDDEIYYFSEDGGWLNTHISVRDGKAVSAENADSADKLKTARTIALSGDVSGETNFDGSANVTINTTIADDSHLHDGRYYTETEIDTKLSGKSDTGHKHSTSDITDFPTTMPPTDHTHDDRYYTENEVDTKLSGKSDTGHRHKKDEITDFPSSMNPTVHTHDASDITQDSEHRMVSDTKISSWDGTYEQSTAYTDKAIADLVGGAPTTLDTLKEIADAMEESKTVTEVLDTAIGAKVSQAEFNSHAGNNTIHVNASEKAAWNKKAEKEHKHAKADITDFPSSMPASDVPSWAKQPNKPSYAYSEITGKPTTFTPATHTHDYLPSTGGTVTGGVVIDKPDSEGDLTIGNHNNYNNKVLTMQNRSRIFNIRVDDDGSIYFKADGENIISMDPGTNDPPYFYGISTGNPTEARLTTELNKKANTTHSHTKSQITDFPSAMSPTAHNQAAGTITAGTLPAGVLATNSTDYTASRLRNIQMSTTDLTAGSSSLANGAIYIVYE